ncbi:hypothetical protein TWF696_008538 [Orbilia brochopaga]|uniref:Uncharacterized protein n=1 Tax=Orbilia brochopaga TaxID=3140254 RepID=A0AAV9UG70_9PEZI
MCYEYHYHSCGLHYYRVTRILPNLCRCPRETQIIDEDEPCDTCDPPQLEAPHTISTQNIQHLKPEDQTGDLEGQESVSGNSSTPWVIDVRGKLKGHEKPTEQVKEDPKKKKSWVSKARNLFKGPAYPENSRRPNDYPVGIRANLRRDKDDEDDTRWDTDLNGQPTPFDEDEDEHNGSGTVTSASARGTRGRWKDFY